MTPVKGAPGGVVLIQPPFAQLNSPYPAPYYLKSFLESRGTRVTVLDHSIALFEKMFSRPGLERIFARAALAYNAGSLPAGRGNAVDAETARIIGRFLSEKSLWLASIDRLVAFLRGRDPEWGHLLALANGAVPGGPRADAFLALRNGEVSPDEARAAATKLLADLADFITCTVDGSFSLIRYTPVMEGSLALGFRAFAAVQKSLDGYIMNEFYRPMLEGEWEKLEKAEAGAVPGGPFLLGLTIPFPGCVAGALVCAESAKKRFGSAARTIAGGGYVNTELRFLDTPEFFEYFDYVSFDRGYGSLVSVLAHIAAGEKGGKPLYKTMYRSGGSVVAYNSGALPGDTAAGSADMPALDDEAAGTVFPDYTEIDYSRYLYPADDANSMHRLWSDGHWLKAYLAHGCYWHSCAFCDVSLDYIKNFIPVRPAALFAHLKDQAEKTGVRGVHLVDEAAPASALLEFAILNREAGLPLNFWGNIRFEKGFDADAARILAAGGLTGVSAGLEVATERGLRALGKGIALAEAVKACAAFKEAGILTHAYLIYGYWDEDEQELIDSAEILRQFFAEGLLDSAFWHKFVLTRHSRIYAEKQRGLHPGLQVKDDPSGEGALFALNDLSFEGEERFNKYAEGLENLLAAWMGGETHIPAARAFPFRVKSPAVPPGFISGLLSEYAVERDRERSVPPVQERGISGANVLFLGSAPRPFREGGNFFLRWRWQLKDRELGTNGIEAAEKLAALLETASGGKGMGTAEFFSSLEEIAGSGEAKQTWICLRENGLAVYTHS